MLNLILIHGYLGRDPEKTTVQGSKGPFDKVTFSVGVSRNFGDETDWFRCEVIGKQADVIDKWFRKGSQIVLAGRMESFKPKNDPNSKAWTVKVVWFDFCDKKVNTDGSSAVPKQDPDPPGMEELTDEDIPF